MTAVPEVILKVVTPAVVETLEVVGITAAAATLEAVILAAAETSKST